MLAMPMRIILEKLNLFQACTEVVIEQEVVIIAYLKDLVVLEVICKVSTKNSKKLAALVRGALVVDCSNYEIDIITVDSLVEGTKLVLELVQSYLPIAMHRKVLTLRD